jgi:hypothetical protein
MDSPLHIVALRTDCACIWTSPTGLPGWTLGQRHPGCSSPVHDRAPARGNVALWEKLRWLRARSS